MLLKLASTELHLETTQFLYEETYKQKEFLEAEYVKLGKKKLASAGNISKGKKSPKYDTAKQLLDGLEEKNYKVFCKKKCVQNSQILRFHQALYENTS